MNNDKNLIEQLNANVPMLTHGRIRVNGFDSWFVDERVLTIGDWIVYRPQSKTAKSYWELIDISIVAGVRTYTFARVNHGNELSKTRRMFIRVSGMGFRTDFGTLKS